MSFACHDRCLNLAAELTATNPSARILICVVDVRSGLQNQLPPVKDGESHTKAALLSCALFRDAASSAVVGTRYVSKERDHMISEYNNDRITTSELQP